MDIFDPVTMQWRSNSDPLQSLDQNNIFLLDQIFKFLNFLWACLIQNEVDQNSDFPLAILDQNSISKKFSKLIFSVMKLVSIFLIWLMNLHRSSLISIRKDILLFLFPNLWMHVYACLHTFLQRCEINFDP